MKQRPLSFAQLRLWFLDQLEPGSADYNLPWLFRLRGPLDTAVLADALNDLAARHEVLRTRFVVDEDGDPLQLIDPEAGLELPLVELDGSSPKEAQAQQLLAEEAVTPFDLERGPLFRARLLRLEPEEHLLSFTAHHIVCDGVSVDIVVQELTASYAARLRGE